MKKKHFAAIGKLETLCGYGCTKQEYRMMQNGHPKFVNCKKCLHIKRAL